MIVIIPVHNEFAMTFKCFDSIQASKDNSLVVNTAVNNNAAVVKIVVIDNASDNPAVLKADVEGRGWIYKRNDVNKWFTEANAEVVAEYPGEDFYMLNNDTEVADGWLSGMAILKDYGAIGAVQTVNQEPRFFQFLGGQDDHAGHKVAWEWRALRDFNWNKDKVCDTEWLTGAAMMVNRKAFDAVGGFDLALKHYCQDSDLSLRLVKAGYKIGVKLDMRVMHHGSFTYNAIGQKNPVISQQGGIDQYNFAQKHKIKCGSHDFRDKVSCQTAYGDMLKDKVIQMRNIEASQKEADDLIKAFPDIVKWRVFEIGCAFGEVLRCLKDKGAVVMGVELSTAAEQFGHDFVVKGDFVKYDNMSKAFDMVYSKAVLEHIPERDITVVISKISEMLLPNGITHHNIDTVHGTDPTYVCIKPVAWWCEQFALAGFETVETRHLDDGIYWCTWRKK